MTQIDRKLYQYIFDLILKDKQYIKEDTISDFLTYEVPHFKIIDKTYVLNAFKNHCRDIIKYDKVIADNKVSFRKKKDFSDDIDDANYNFNKDKTLNSIIEDEYDIDERQLYEENNIQKINIIIKYIKDLPTYERELFKQYYINKLSTRKLAAMYNINYNKIYNKVRKYKKDIKCLYLIDQSIKEINTFMIKLERNKWVYNSVDALKIANYHIILFEWKDSKYDQEEKTIYEMIEDIKNELK